MKKPILISLVMIVFNLCFSKDAFCSQYTGGTGDGWYAIESTDFSLGGPNVTLSSSVIQIFSAGQTATAISSKTISDLTGGAITALNDIRIRIPSGFNMAWDSSDTSVNLGGTASGKVSGTVTYEGVNKVLVLNVTSNFSTGEYVTMSELSFTNFNAESPADNLELDIYNSGVSYTIDDKYIQIKSAASAPFIGGTGDGWSSLASSDFPLGGANVSLVSNSNQIFSVGQSTAAISSITITDSTGGAVTSLNDIRVRIPSGFNMEWYTPDTAASISGTASSKVSTTVSYAGTNRILIIDVASNFSSGEYITLAGLSFTNFSAASVSDNLELDIYNSGVGYCVDSKYIQINAASSAPFLGGSGDGWAEASSSDISPFLAKPGSAIAYWRLDEGTGTTIYDDTTSDNDGVLSLGSSGNTTIANAWVDGKFGKSLSFDGTDDAVSVNDAASLDVTDAITICAWVKPANVFGSNHEILQKSGAYGLKMTSDGKFIGYRSGGPENHFSTATAQAGNWYFVAMTYDRAQHKIYVNGALENQEADTFSIPASANSINIGGGGNKFPGIIDDVKIYSYARTADEIMVDYSHGAAYLGAGTKGAACVAHWRFDEGGGPTTYDETTNNNDGTLVGNAKFVNGKIGKAIELDGNGDYIELATNPINTSTWTIGMWFNIHNSDQYDMLYSGADNVDIQLFFDAATKYLTTSVENTERATTFKISDHYNEWHYVAWTHSDSNQTIVYVDGQIVLNTTDTTYTKSGETIRIGQVVGASAYYIDGLIDDARIYNYARTSEQIMVDYNAGFSVRLGAGTDPFEGNPPSSHWNFDENTGTTTLDRSGNGKDGTLGGGTQDYTPSWTLGQFGSGLKFDGNDYVSLPSNFMTTPSAISIGCWFKTNSAGSNMLLLSIEGYYGIYIGFQAPGKITAFFDGSTSGHSAATTAYNDNNWHYCLAKNNGATTVVYVDGIKVLTFSENLGDIGLVNRASAIGSQYDGASGYFSGSIDDVKIYDYSRSIAQVSYDYDRGKPMSYYRFDEGKASMLYDESNNNNDGTLNLGAQGNTAVSSAWAIGKFGYALDFDGTDDYVSAGVVGFNPEEGTIDLWVSPDWAYNNPPRADWIIPVSIYNSNSDRVSIVYDCVNKNWEVHSGGGVLITGSQKTFFSGEWLHLTVIWNDTSSKLYYNGVEIGSGTNPTVTSGVTTAAIGGYQAWASYYFDGKIDAAKVYNYARTANQILQDYNYGTAVRLGR